jgi:metallo-beta-lactamase class B
MSDKSTEAIDLGYPKDGNVQAYAETIHRVQARFPDAAYVIPGHQGWTSTNSLQHTLDLVQGQRTAAVK